MVFTRDPEQIDDDETEVPLLAVPAMVIAFRQTGGGKGVNANLWRRGAKREGARYHDRARVERTIKKLS